MIPAIWHAQEDGRGRFNCTAMLNDMFDLYEDVLHFGGASMVPQVEGAVVVVHGGRQMGSIDRLNTDIDRYKWVLLIFLGDEECSFPIEQVEHSNKKIWIQEPMVPGRHEFADRFILDGYSHDFVNHVVRCPKDLDWVFAGQVTHERRRACVTALQTIDWGGVIIETKGFCQGVSRREYSDMLSRAWIVPCPSGPMAQDAARPWEALEAGCIPILDNFSPKRTTPGFWELVLGERHPFPVIDDWSTLPELIRSIKEHNVQMLAEECASWWYSYKRKWSLWLKEDLEELGCSTIKSPF